MRAEERRLVRFLEKASKRASEVSFFVSRLGILEQAMRMSGRGRVARQANGLLARIRDRRLKELFKAFIASNDGTAKVTRAEKQAFLQLSFELEESLAELKRKSRRLQAIRVKLADFVTPRMKRKMLKMASSLLGKVREGARLAERLSSLEVEMEVEEEACRLEPARSRKKLRELRGKVAVLRKTVEMNEAQTAFAMGIRTALADDRITESERRELARMQSDFLSLKHTLAGLKAERY